MKNFTFILLLFWAVTVYSQNEKILFIHHSTGGNVYSEGNVASWITNYNTAHSKNYQITERAYPDSPYPWDNYPYDYWNLWVNPSSTCNSIYPNIECINTITQNYNVIIYKHCFPGAGIGEDEATSSVSSSTKTLGNYKLQYRALRNMMDGYPNNKFIVWTLAPLHRNATNTADAARARQFVDWVKTQWLTEDGKSHPNIYIFDFYGIVAESNATPVNGKVNCLKYDYEGSHTGDDSHPNTAANLVAGPAFGQFIVDCIEKGPSAIPAIKQSINVRAYPNPSNGKLTIETDVLNAKAYISIVNPNGKEVYHSQLKQFSADINISNLANGLYFYTIKNGNKSVTQKLMIQK